MRLKIIANRCWCACVIAHRYLGVAMSVPMMVWFLSGIVMMYVSYPHLGEDERVRTLMPIDWQACCRFDAGVSDDAQIMSAQLENIARTPALRLHLAGRPTILVDLAQGLAVPIDADCARTIALEAASRIIGQASPLISAERIQMDQWTIGLVGRPLFRFMFGDAERTTIYVSTETGAVVRWTTAPQRFWNWFGAIPHWFYVADLRVNHSTLWSGILISGATLGTCLTALGLYLGISQFEPGAGISPFSGWHYWHHVLGFVFGIATLTWVASGLVSLNPFGFLAQPQSREETLQLAGDPLRWREIRASLDIIRTRAEVTDAVSVVSAPLAGRLFWSVKYRDGTSIRLDANGSAAQVDASELADALRIAGVAAISEQRMLEDEDAYYLRRDGFVLPVYRIILNDAERSRIYLDPNTGALLQRVGASDRRCRWLFGALHRLDFAPFVRMRPAWDLIVLTLLLGGSGLTITGISLALGRIGNDLRSLFRAAEKSVKTAAKSSKM
jgi:hypothetical protein